MFENHAKKAQKTHPDQEAFCAGFCSSNQPFPLTLLPRMNPEKRPFKRCFRAIARDAIEVAWNRGRLDVTNQLLGVTLFNERDKPTNGEFISLIAAKAAGE